MIPKNQIIVTVCTDGVSWRAEYPLAGISGYGNSPTDAIGALVARNHRVFSLSAVRFDLNDPATAFATSTRSRNLQE